MNLLLGLKNKYLRVTAGQHVAQNWNDIMIHLDKYIQEVDD